MAEGEPRFRRLTGACGAAQRLILSALPLAGGLYLLDLHLHVGLVVLREQYLAFLLSFGLAAVFMSVPARPLKAEGRLPWHDGLLSLLGLFVGFYLMLFYPELINTLGELKTERILLAALAIALVLEATRRLFGWVMLLLVSLVLLYARYGDLLPGPLLSRGSSWERLLTHLYIGNDALLGVPLDVVGTVVLAFVFFGQALYAVGGDKFLTDLSLIAMGRYRGGSAKVAVVSSSLFGTVSGSAVANVVVDGAITIPMMKRAGYPPHLAAAIEAVSSNGGQIMPPVMGAAAFLMAEFLGVPYREVALAALIPACLYYLALFIQVDLEAAKLGLSGLPPHEIPKLRTVMRYGWAFLMPLLLLIHSLMIANWQPGKAGMAALLATFVIGALQRRTRPTFKQVMACVEETGRTFVDIVVIAALAGVVIGALQISGLTFTFSLLLLNAAGGNLFVLLILTAVVCILLGLSLPTTVVYITLAVLVGPALVQVGIVPIAAHLFLFYFGMLSLITPPDCLATYTAAAIARADFWKTGWTGMRLAIAAYVVPFVFAFHPSLLLRGSIGEVTLAVITASLGVGLLSVACAGYLFRPLSWGKRALFSAAGLISMLPTQTGGLVAANGVGLALGLLLVLWERNSAPLAETSSRL